MEIMQKYHNRSCKLRISGRSGPASAARAGMLLGNLAKAGYENILLNLAEAQADGDAAALAHMLEVYQRINRGGARIILEAPSDRLLFHLQRRRVQGFLVAQDHQAALDALGMDAVELADAGVALCAAR